MLRIQCILNLEMTFEAFLAADFVAGFVALQAIINPFELLMGFRQFSGGELSECVVDSNQQRDCTDDMKA